MIVGVGCDITNISRFEKNRDHLALKVLTQREKAYYDNVSETRKLEYLAGRFAAKEAIFKAVGDATLTLSQIEVLHDEHGKPICSLAHGKIHISISHEKEYAMAYALCERVEE